MTARVTKHFVTVGNRRVHYHRAGEGPATLLLHASPCSVKVLRLPLEIFATRFTAVAIDTPGFGLSDPLPGERLEIENFADAAADTLAALGIEHTSVYGRHTGAQIAVELAVRHPARCSMALTDGYPVFSPDMDWSRIDEYLLPLVPSWDGTHLIWAWYRYREQHIFWPWNAQRLANRADSDMPDCAFLQRGVVELLEAGDGYRIGYASAFRHQGRKALEALTVPTCFGGRPGDSLYTHLKLLPDHVWRMEMPRDAHAAARAELAMLLKHPARGTPPPAPATAPLPGRSTPDYVDLHDSQVLIRSIGDLRSAAPAPVVVIHHAPGSSALYDDLIRAIGAKHPVIALDLPGHGESEPGPDAIQSVEAWAETVFRVLNTLGIGAMHVYGHNGGAAVAVEMALRASGRVRSITLDAPVFLSEAEQQDVAPRWLDGVLPATPVWDGSHLLRMWHMRRDMALWWPWYSRRIVNARASEPPIDPGRLSAEVREMMKQPESFASAWRAVLDYPMRARLALTVPPCAVIGAATDLFAPCLAAARGVRPDARAMDIDDSAQARADAVLSNIS